MPDILLNINGTVRKIIAVTVITEASILIARALSGKGSDLRVWLTLAAVMLPVFALIFILRGGISLPKTGLIICVLFILCTLVSIGVYSGLLLYHPPYEPPFEPVWIEYPLWLSPPVITFLFLFLFFRFRKIKVNSLFLLAIAFLSFAMFIVTAFIFIGSSS